jgi:hypothetical protein
MSDPRTAAGRALLAWSESDVRPLDEFGYPTVLEAIFAIEAEASAHADAQTSLARLDLAEAQAAPDALDANTLTDLLIDILSSAEYEKMDAEGRAAKALHMEWHETQDRYVTTGKTIRTPATPPASAERDAVVAAAALERGEVWRRRELARHQPIVFAPATDEITLRCTCGALVNAVPEGEYMDHVIARLRAQAYSMQSDALRAAEARDE